jgi:hypothetical protein
MGLIHRLAWISLVEGVAERGHRVVAWWYKRLRVVTVSCHVLRWGWRD